MSGEYRKRGELLIRGPSVFKGYFKDEDLSKEMKDQDGWLHTGDIAEILSDGSVKLIDRKKSLFKLAQGEYVAAEKLESLYLTSEAVEEIFVSGHPMLHQCVAVIYPKKEFCEKKGAQLKKEWLEFKTLISFPEIKQAIIDSLNQIADKEKLQYFERIKKIHLTDQPFISMDLLSSTNVIKRRNATHIFAAELKELYDELAKEQEHKGF